MFKRDRKIFYIHLLLILCIILMAHTAHSNGDMVAEIIKGLKSKDPVQREFYASAVMALRPDSREVVSHLITALKDENENVRKVSAMRPQLRSRLATRNGAGTFRTINNHTSTPKDRT